MPDYKVSLGLRSDADFPCKCLGESLVFFIYEEAPFQLPSWTVFLRVTVLAKVLMGLRVARYPSFAVVLWDVWQLSCFYICTSNCISLLHILFGNVGECNRPSDLRCNNL